MLTVATLLWQANDKSLPFSRCYDETWVEKLYRGFRRNLTVPFQFVVFTDRAYSFDEPIERAMNADLGKGGYSDCILPYIMNEPMILVGLDTIVTGNCDHLADYCMTADKIALPLDPYMPSRVCNGVSLCPAGMQHVYTEWRGENDMDWMRKQPHAVIDTLFPGQVQSYKGAVKAKGIGDTRICYFHGEQKPHQLKDIPWISKHWW